MKATGMTRRIDELGRIVVPKEIRKQLKIHEGQTMEIYLNEQKEIVLRKYSELSKLDENINMILEILFNQYSVSCLICDLSEVRYAAGKNNYRGKPISTQLGDILNNRKVTRSEQLTIVMYETIAKSCFIHPLIISGDLVGGVIYIVESRPVNEELFNYTTSLLLKAMI